MNPFNSLVILLTLVAAIQSREIRQNRKLMKEPSIISGIQGDSRFNFLTGENSGVDLGLNSFSLPYPYERELIDLGVSSSPQQGIFSQGNPCATVLTTSNCVIKIPEDATHKNIADRQFTLAFGLIKEQCSLTIRDCSGSYFTASNYLHGSVCSTAVSVCCECNGCNRPPSQIISDYDGDSDSTTCAVLFEHERCSLCHGFRLQVGRGDKTMKMNDFVDNKVSSIYVMAGCELIIYQESNFQGFAALAQGSLDYLPPEWNDVISSFQCNCNSGFPPLSTTPEPQPPTTLTPIETMTTTQAPSTTSGSSEMPTPTTTMATTTVAPVTTMAPMTTTTTFDIPSTTMALPETSTVAPIVTTTSPPDITTTAEPTTSTTEEIRIPIY